MADELRTITADFETHLAWLESAAGHAASRKFMDAKIYVPQYSGMYISGLLPSVDGYRVLIELLKQLKDGLTVPLIDVESYYTHGRRVPAGMRLEGNKLVDTWAMPEL